MSNPIQWNKVTNFEMKEFDDPNYPDSGKLINYKIVYDLDHLREVIKCPIIVLAAVDVYGEHGHSPNSFHLAKNHCRAVDFYIETDMLPRKQYYYVERAGFGGIGVYLTLWHDKKGVLLPIAFHIDSRPISRLQRWSCRMKGQYEYLLGS
ncbi:MAG: hypothetical protein KAX30_04365 [Candidatus Atribacteria bacterium]|nr:hypothetical protein [Candidatus Atribacteria bacterium]